MFVDPDKPLPLDEDKKDGLGSVLNAIIEINNLRTELEGTAEEFEVTIAEQETLALNKINQFANEIDTSLKNHADRVGAVHGETKTTVGLDKKENWRTATIAEHEEGLIKTAFTTPLGLQALVDKRLRISPNLYIKSRILPFASGGQLGCIPQTPFDWKEGEVVQSPQDPLTFYTDTPWQFLTDQGIQIYPAMNGSSVLTQHTADAGRSKRASTAYGGTTVHIYKSVLDIRRTRPSHLSAESDSEPNNELIKASSHLFDRHSIFYAKQDAIGIRGFNKNRLPFDTLVDNTTVTNWSGIVESREKMLYNIYAHMEKGDIGGYGNGIYLVIETDLWSFIENGLDCQNGPGRAAETSAVLDKKIDTITYSVPANGKIRLLPRENKPSALCIKLTDLISFSPTLIDTLWEKLQDKESIRMAFTWRSRLKGDFAIRIPIGFESVDGTAYTNYYMDIGFLINEDLANASATTSVTSLRDIETASQTLNTNLIINTPGKFIQYPSKVVNDVFHPKIFNGTFNSLGGHVKTYTFYNRQYVGYYQHDVKSVYNWIANGDLTSPNLNKYTYGQVSTLNNDGMYGDHLRHIPIGNGDGVSEYLTLTRDWSQAYRWGITKVATDTIPEMLTPTGHHIGPWRLGTNWLNIVGQKVPSFLIVNSESAATFETNCLVFNSQNSFKGYARYGYDTSNLETPLQWIDEVSLDESITTYVSRIKPNWVENHKQFFYYKSRLYYFNQCLSVNGLDADNVDCYYGWIDSAYIDTDGNNKKSVKITGDIADKITVKPLKVNTRETLGLNVNGVLGWDEFNSTDVYMMLMSKVDQIQKYKLMVNLAPFNNFYFEFDLTIDGDALTTDVSVSTNTIDPVFPYNPSTGFGVDYDKIIAYGSKTPHRLHVNFQSPVMLKKSMWSFRKTPGQYGIFSETTGTAIATGGILNSVAGVPIYPVGSVLTIGGSNVVVRNPVSAGESDFDGNDELYSRLNGGGSQASSQIELFGVKHNPNEFDLEPNSGITPCGFLRNGIFYHYDPDGWRNALLPVVDGKRMSFFGYGSSFPAFMGSYGSGLPINRFFLIDGPTVLAWDTSVGRIVPISDGSAIKIYVNDVLQTYNNSGSFQIPETFTGAVTVKIVGITKVQWGIGLINLITIGNTVSQLDFSGSTQFSINATLPKRITSLAGLFSNATGANYPGLDQWDTTNIVSLAGAFQGAINFNQNLSGWNTINVETMASTFEGAVKFNTSIRNWNVSSVTTFSRMFKGALAFNQDLSGWNTRRGITYLEMFSGAILFNGNVSTWNVARGSIFTSMFEEAVNFNGNLTSWDMSGAVNLDKMFKRASKFNSNLNTWNVAGVTSMNEMFSEAVAFSRDLSNWNTSKVTSTIEMFYKTVLFGADSSFELSNWDMSSVTDATRMFGESNFNCKVDGWSFGKDCWLFEMFIRAATFDQDVSSWNVRNVLNMAGIFRETAAFNRDIVGWNLQSCVAMANIFNLSTYSGNLVDWVLNTEPHPTIKINMTSAFANAQNFNSPGIKTWNVGGVITMDTMFAGAITFNQDLSSWNVSGVTSHTGFDTGAMAWVLPKPNFPS